MYLYQEKGFFRNFITMSPNWLRGRSLLRCRLLLWTLLTLSLSLPCSGSAVNYTLDDTNFDQRMQDGATVTYSSTGQDAWAQGNGCSFCALKPDASLAFNHTWHDTTFTLGDTGQESMEVNFVGTFVLAAPSGLALMTSLIILPGSAIYAYFIVPDQVTDPTFTYTVNLTVTLDGEVVDNFLHSPSNSGNDFIYNFLGYMNDKLELKSHVLSFTPSNEPSSSLVLFDYAIYTCVSPTYQNDLILP